MVEFTAPQEFSLYFHLPFCTRKCGYCHFYVLPDRTPLKEQLLKALETEWQRLIPLMQGKRLVSIYFGGGTPSLFGPDRISQILEWIDNSSISRAASLEITLEANPEEMALDLVRRYRDVGINRLSIGVQALDDQLLKQLTRRHSAKEAKAAVGFAEKSGISNISIDLMYDIPGQTLDHWQATLREAIELPITHLSLYNMTIEPDAAFFRRRKAIQLLQPPDEVSRAMYELAREELSQGLFHQYELSAFARAQHQSRHNTGYWTGRPFLGLGPSAFSYWEGRRYRNVASLDRYSAALEAGESPVDFEETLSPEAQTRELFVIRLRLREGVVMRDFEPLDQSALKRLKTAGWVREQNGILQLTDEGLLFYDSVASELI